MKQLHVSHLPFLLSNSVLNPKKTAVGDQVLTIITSAGGKGFTLATSGAGEIETVFGKVYTIATAVIESKPTSSKSSSAAFVHAGVQTPLLVALGSVLVGALLGMMMIL